mmetsp:Transcript_24414/g.57280  ORF Transcript_24414/g.57280 Transcript_24414/m.57280 type:complete len:243 (+) Transcript_24414:92-820(+)
MCCFQINAFSIPSLLSQGFRKIVQTLGINTKIQISYTRAGSNLNSLLSWHNGELQIVNVAIFKSFKLRINITRLGINFLNLESATVDVALPWLVRTDNLLEFCKCLLLIISLGPRPGRDDMLRFIVRIVRRAKAIGSRSTVLQSHVFVSSHVDPLGNSQILGLWSTPFGLVGVLVADFIGKGSSFIGSSHKDGRDRDGTGKDRGKGLPPRNGVRCAESSDTPNERCQRQQQSRSRVHHRKRY